MTCRGIHLEFAPGGGIRWEIEGTDGTWEPEKNMMRSDRMVTIRGPGLVLTGHRLAVDFSSDTVSLGEGVTASVEGFWLEQK